MNSKSIHSPIVVAIVNYRTPDLTINCLRSLQNEVQSLPNCQVIVADNASPDDSITKIHNAINAHQWNNWASLMILPRNGGFAYGNNAIIRHALQMESKPHSVWLLNPDTIVKPGALTTLVDFLEQHPQAGIVGSSLEDEAGTPQPSAHRFPSPLSELDDGARLGPLTRALQNYIVSPPIQKKSHKCDWVSGASMLVCLEVFEQIGLLDEEYFLYYEEVDFCKRANQIGFECWFLPSIPVKHLEGKATGIQQSKKRRPSYWYDSRRRFFLKHYSIAGLVAADLLWAAGRLTLATRKAFKLGGNWDGDPSHYALDLLWGDLKHLLSKLNFRRGKHRNNK